MFGKIQEMTQTESTPFYPGSPYGTAKLFRLPDEKIIRKATAYTHTAVFYSIMRVKGAERNLLSVRLRMRGCIRSGLSGSWQSGCKAGLGPCAGLCPGHVGVAGIPIVWKGNRISETGRNHTDGRGQVWVHPKFFRLAEVEVLWRNLEKAEKELGWKRENFFEHLLERMGKSDMEQ